MKVVVVGATGIVGKTMIRVLEERNFPVTDFMPVASDRSVNKKIIFKGNELTVQSVSNALDFKPDIALFSAGSGLSLQVAPEFAKLGTVVIDNSSAWRMDPLKKLIIPEINGDILTKEDKIIANPNCSTIQMLMAIAPLHWKYRINRIVVSTYQSVTGSGIHAVKQLEAERLGKDEPRFYPHKIDMNCLPHIDVFEQNGYTKEEMKMVNETHKILADPTVKVTATTVRVPVTGGHSESVNLEFDKTFQLSEILSILKEAPGITIVDNPSRNEYPMPINSKGKDDVFVGRIRLDESRENCLNLWIVSDNLRKGAATNAIQIAEKLISRKLI